MDDFEDFLSSETATPLNVSSVQPAKPKTGDKDASFFLDEDLDFDTLLVGTSVTDAKKVPTQKSSLASGSTGMIYNSMRIATDRI